MEFLYGKTNKKSKDYKEKFLLISRKKNAIKTFESLLYFV